MLSLCSVVLLSCALIARGQAASAAAGSSAVAAPGQLIEGCDQAGTARVCITGTITGTTLNVQCRGENYPLGSSVNIYLFFFPFTAQRNNYTDPLHEGCFFRAFEAAEYVCSFTTDLSLFAKGTSFECSFNHKYPPKPFLTKADDSHPPAVKTISKAWRPKALLSCTDKSYQPRLAWRFAQPRVKGVAPNVTLFTPGTQLRAFCLLACHNVSDSNELVWKLGDRVLKNTSVLTSAVENFTLEYDFARDDDGKLLECSLIKLNKAATEPIVKLTTTLTNGENYTIVIDDLEPIRKMTIPSISNGVISSPRPIEPAVDNNAEVATEVEQQSGQFREGCDDIGVARICVQGNVTGTTLHVECTGEHYPLGSSVNIYLFFYPHTEQRNNYTEPLFEGCYFREWEVVKYTCSFTTDISLFKPGTTFECAFNHKYPEKSFFTKTDASLPLRAPIQSLVRRPEPLLNCKDRMGRPALLWSVSTQPDSQVSTRNITLFTPDTLLNVFCVLACHNYPTPLETWDLVWKLDDRVLSDQSIMDMRVENFTLKYNLAKEDNGKVLECSLRKQELNSVETLVKVTTTLVMYESPGSPPDSSKGSANALEKRESSNSSPWAVAGPVLVVLAAAVAVAVVFWRRRTTRRGMWLPRALRTSHSLIQSEGDESAAAEFMEVRQEHGNYTDASL